MLDKRLSACMSLVSGDVACDVGTDHGYLPAELLTSGKCRFCYACDINEMPLKSAEKTLSSINMDGKWRCILSDGLKAADDEALSDITDIICAGMGGELISQIIGNSHTAKKARLILQPMTQAAFLRRYLCENGFHIISELPVDCGKHVYTVLAAEYDGKKHDISDIEETFGFCEKGSPDHDKYIERRILQLSRAAEGMLSSDPDSPDGLRIMSLIDRFKNEG